MKTVLALLAFLGVFATTSWGLSDDLKEMIQMLHNQCRDEVGVEEEVIVKAQKGDIDENNEKLQCYMKCIFIQSGAMNDDGSFDAETAVATLPPELSASLGPAMMACKNAGGDGTPCMKAIRINECISKKAGDAYFLP